MEWKELVDRYYKGKPLSYGGKTRGAAIVDDSLILERTPYSRAYNDDGVFKLSGYAMIPREEFERLLVAAEPRTLWQRWVSRRNGQIK